jgi:hypothetical protein
MFSIDPRTGRRLVGRFTFNRDGGNDGGNAGGGAGEAERNLQNLLAKKNGDAVALAAQLLAENADLRAKRRTVEEERDALKAKVPAEGSVILTGDDARTFGELTAATPLKDLKGKLDEATTATSKLQTLERQQTVRDAADALGWDAKRLERLLKDAPLEVKTEKRDGKDVTVYAVKDGETTVALEEAFQDFLPALTAQGAGSGQQEKSKQFYAGPGTRDAKPPTPEELAAAKRATGEYTL